MGKIDISELEKHIVLAALYNGAICQIIDFEGELLFPNIEMTIAQAKKFLNINPSQKFYYIKNKHLDIDLSTDRIDSSNYNYYNGINSAQEIIQSLRKDNNPQSIHIQRIRKMNTRKYFTSFLTITT